MRTFRKTFTRLGNFLVVSFGQNSNLVLFDLCILLSRILLNDFSDLKYVFIVDAYHIMFYSHEVSFK